MAYAENTSVPIERSRAEIEGSLIRYGAESFVSGWNNGAAVIQFTVRKRLVRFVLPLPDPAGKEFSRTPSRQQRRTPDGARQAYEQELRRRWRALALVVKAKLEAVNSGIVTFEDEFLAHFVMPNGQPLGRWLAPQLEAAYATGEMPLLALPGATS